MAVDLRQTIVSAFGSWGYREAPDLARSFAELSGWSADLIFKHDLDNLAVLVRETSDIPEYITEMLARKPLPKQFKLGIVSTSSQFVGFDNITAAVKYGIIIYRVSDASVSVYVDPGRVNDLARLDDIRIEEVRRRYKTKSVPLTIVQLLRNSRNLRYSQLLRRFAADYESRGFASEEEENSFILICIKALFRKVFPDGESVKSIEALETLENLMQREGIRDHFLHSFQVFLLGSIILDYHYYKISSWYSNCFAGSGSVAVEDTWLLASLLHDAVYPFLNLKKWSGLGAGVAYEIRLETPRRRAQLLASLFEHSRQIKIKKAWHSDLVDRVKNPGIERIAMSQASPKPPEPPNHAAISSFSLLGKESILPQVIFCQEICPAALAIFLHDPAVWLEMHEVGKLLPLDMKQFPLAFLLIYCDGLQEWGRKGGKVDPQGKNSCLLDLKLDQNSVVSTIWFDDPANAIMMEVQHARILSEIAIPREINFRCEVITT